VKTNSNGPYHPTVRQSKKRRGKEILSIAGKISKARMGKYLIIKKSLISHLIADVLDRQPQILSLRFRGESFHLNAGEFPFGDSFWTQKASLRISK